MQIDGLNISLNVIKLVKNHKYVPTNILDITLISIICDIKWAD